MAWPPEMAPLPRAKASQIGLALPPRRFHSRQEGPASKRTPVRDVRRGAGCDSDGDGGDGADTRGSAARQDRRRRGCGPAGPDARPRVRRPRVGALVDEGTHPLLAVVPGLGVPGRASDGQDRPRAHQGEERHATACRVRLQRLVERARKRRRSLSTQGQPTPRPGGDQDPHRVRHPGDRALRAPTRRTRTNWRGG